VRDQGSTTYVAAIESPKEFGLRRYTEAWQGGWSRAHKKVVIAEGGVWIWDLANDVVNQADYFERNTERMRHPKFRVQGRSSDRASSRPPARPSSAPA
jgi:hypothetical protein